MYSGTPLQVNTSFSPGHSLRSQHHRKLYKTTLEMRIDTSLIRILRTRVQEYP